MSKVRIRAASVITCSVGGDGWKRGPSGRTARGDFCQSWRGQAAAHFNRRAARPNAARDRNNNAKVEPASGTDALHTPGMPRFIPETSFWPGVLVRPVSNTFPDAFSISMMLPPNRLAKRLHIVIDPVGPVPNRNDELAALRSVIVCTPSENEKASGVTIVSGMLGPKGLASVTVAVTRSLVV